MRRAVLLIAHRGDPAHAPENTLTSFGQAIRKGARAIEMDVRRSHDGVWVAFHDPTLRRMTGRVGRLATTPRAVLRTLRIGSTERIPTLSAVLTRCRRRRIRVFIDLKVSGHERDLLACLRRSRGLSSVILGVGSPIALRRWRTLLPRQPLFWVTRTYQRVTPRRIALARRLSATGLAVNRRWVTARVVREVHAAGLALYVWTIKTPRDLARYSALGVDGLMNEVWPVRR